MNNIDVENKIINEKKGCNITISGFDKLKKIKKINANKENYIN
jgi:hypothetical protein